LLYHKLNLQVSFKKLKKIVIYAKGLGKQFLSLASARFVLERECAQLEKFLNLEWSKAHQMEKSISLKARQISIHQRIQEAWCLLWLNKSTMYSKEKELIF
jgi:hypothetical protein